MPLLITLLDGEQDFTIFFIIKNKNESNIQECNYCVCKKNMSNDTYVERKSPFDIYTGMKLRTFKLILSLGSFKYVYDSRWLPYTPQTFNFHT